jgi:phage-related protein
LVAAYGRCAARFRAIGIARVLVFVDKGRIGVLHGVIKKTQKTPADALALADKRMKEMKK